MSSLQVSEWKNIWMLDTPRSECLTVDTPKRLNAWYLPNVWMLDTSQTSECLILPKHLNAWYSPNDSTFDTSQTSECLTVDAPKRLNAWYLPNVWSCLSRSLPCRLNFMCCGGTCVFLGMVLPSHEHHITSHYITRHHMTSHDITWDHITSHDIT